MTPRGPISREQRDGEGVRAENSIRTNALEPLRLRGAWRRRPALLALLRFGAPARVRRGFAKVTRDLTERREAMRSLRLAHAEEAVRRRGEFLSIAAHELRMPLAGPAAASSVSRAQSPTSIPAGVKGRPGLWSPKHGP
jgi:signal transduction histidine kinase